MEHNLCTCDGLIYAYNDGDVAIKNNSIHIDRVISIHKMKSGFYRIMELCDNNFEEHLDEEEFEKFIQDCIKLKNYKQVLTSENVE